MHHKIQLKSFFSPGLLISLLFAFVLLFAICTPAQEQQVPAVELPPEDPPGEETYMEAFERTFIDSNVVISNWFDGIAEGIDLFLVRKKVTDEPSKINAKLINSSYLIEGQGYRNTTSLSVSPRLYNLEKYWSLKFTTYDDVEDTRGVRRGYLRQRPRDQQYGATVGLFRRLGAIRVAFQPRIELQDPLQVSHSLGFESVADLKAFKINPKLEFYASAAKGTGTFHSLNFNFILTDIFSLTLINEGDYEDKLHRYSVTNGISVGQFLTDLSSLTYTALVYSNNRDNYHIEGYNISVSWYRLIYNKIMDVQLVPNLDFTREDSFRGRAGLTLHLTVYF